MDYQMSKFHEILLPSTATTIVVNQDRNAESEKSDFSFSTDIGVVI